jgi:hypothetical protein
MSSAICKPLRLFWAKFCTDFALQLPMRILALVAQQNKQAIGEQESIDNIISE